MHTAEVEKGHIQMNGGRQVFQRLATSETQSRKTVKTRPRAQVSSFEMRRADVFPLPSGGRPAHQIFHPSTLRPNCPSSA